MSMTDPIADMLTRVRNGIMAKQSVVNIPASTLKVEIAKILKVEEYIGDLERIDDGKQGVLKILLKYTDNGQSVITGIERVSRPGCRVYTQAEKIQKVLGGLGINILSTSKGLLTGENSRKQGVGGEVLCNIW